MHIHDIEIVVIWLLSVNAGTILTLLTPRMVSESRSCEVAQVECEHIPVPEEFYERAA